MNGQGNDVSDLLYEVDEKGRQTLVRSIEANINAYVRFTNKTKRKVDVFWRDYQGKKQFYVRLDPGSFYDANSYLSHPWEFSDSSTGETYVISNSPVFRPPRCIGGKNYRTNWNITVRVRSLRLTCLIAVGSRIRNPELVSELCLPRVLAGELQIIIEELHQQPPLTPQE